ncbi:TusE/DsrC/DsvC family sulfur relay protein [Ketobacter alkanivorans]|uniref:Sulfurtransferase n=1 Tax=Ketobacter alkanivorans TaxID=1917421 RepID=A0A2K9LEX6_9GAMM|nr:TusE/DsrC/DsvC family sulfur relay protein [Ketobacter alkanivorans]AUM10928.1 sulfurtransferase TusE [Ketobacter alkanivorans]MCP5015569.1 TusE/DsrC/DsvC family sulfur relay protein [Ketobacter sp.]
MAILIVNQQNIALDKDGYLLHLSDWSEPAALAMAEEAGIQLTDAHWEIVRLLQQFHREFEHSPAMRILVKYVKQHLGEEKGNSIYLMQLFPGSPAKLAARIAGLPRPTNCL